MKLVQWGIFAGLTLLLAAVFHCIPRLRKRNLYFGVTVAENFRESEEGRAIAREFRVWLWAGTVLTLGVSWGALEFRQTLLFTLTPDLQILAAVLAWLRAWRRTKRHSVRPAGIRSVEIVQAPGASIWGLLGLVLPPFGPIAAAVFLWLNYSELPEHWGRYTGRLRSGDVDHFIDKSPVVVFATPVIAGVVLLLCLAIGLGIRYASRCGSSGERAGWASKSRRLNLMMLTAIMWIVSLMTSVISVTPLLSSRTIDALLPASVVALLAALIGFGVSLVRLSMEKTGGSDATPDECWKGGVIYCNPSDSALMVEKRSGIGYTLNFGNRIAWVILGFVLLLPILAIAVAVGLK
jgi:uncharacterized membrane protein